MVINEPFSKFLENFVVLNEKNSEIFFVDRGCGQVYILKNDSIYRHDHSFHHQNQYGGLFFIYNNEPHIFGGYGLFTYKNIITRYDLEDREWYHYEVKGDSPKPRKAAKGNFVNGKLYIFGGERFLYDKKTNYFDCWVFDFKTLKWTNIGNTNNSPTSQMESENLKITFSEEYLITPNLIYQFNFPKNKIEIFKNPFSTKLKNIIKFNNLSLIYKIDHHRDFSKFEIVDNYRLVHRSSIDIVKQIEPNSKPLILIAIISFICIVILGFVLKSRFKRKVKTFKHSFDPMELKLLALFFENENQGIEISLINDIVNQDNPSIDTLKKRRENLVRELKSKISKECKIPVETVFLEEKSALDKRIKIMKLNPVVLKRYAGLFDAN